MLSEDNLSSSQTEYVTTLRNNAYELLSLLNDLVDIAKLDGDKSSPVKNTIVVKDFVEEIIKQFDEKIDKNRIELLYQVDNNVPEKTKLDLQKLRFILVNLITVSLRLTEQGKISLSVFSSEKNNLRFRITDTGIGIPSNKLEQFFNPFAVNDLFNSGIVNFTIPITGICAAAVTP